MKNKYLAYINTGKNPQTIHVEAVVDGTKRSIAMVLAPGELLNEAKVSIQAGQKAELLDIRVADNTKSGAFRSIIPEKLDTPEKILQKSKVLDIETGGLRPGSPITQIAVTDVHTRKSKLFIPTANLVATPSSIEQSMSFLDRIKARGIQLPDKFNTHQAAVYLETYLEKEGMDLNKVLDRRTLEPTLRLISQKDVKSDIEDYMLRNNFFQAKNFVEDTEKVITFARENRHLGKDAAEEKVFREKRTFVRKMLDGSVTEKEVMDYLRANQGVLDVDKEMASLDLIKGRTLRDIITSDLPDNLKGGVTWIANTGFESAQFGAQVKAEASRAMEAYNASLEAKGSPKMDEQQFFRAFNAGRLEQELTELNRGLPDADRVEVKNPFLGATSIDYRTGKPFDMFGEGEFGKVRAQAMITGDFSQVYDAMLKDTSVGDVRDVQDLSRSMQSKLSKIGLLDIQRPTALSVEIQARFAIAAQEMRLMEEAGEEIDMDRIFKALASKETHVAVGDTVLSESPLLRESFDMLESLRQVELGTARGDELIEQAKQGRGGLYRAYMVGALQDDFNKGGLDEVLFRQMAGRSFEDVAVKGSTEFRDPAKTMGVKRAVREVQEGLTESRVNTSPKYRYRQQSNMFEIFRELENTTQYQSANKKEFLNTLRAQVSSFFDADGNLIEGKRDELKLAMRQYTESTGSQIKAIESRISRVDSSFFEALRGFAGFQETRPDLRVTQGVYGYGTARERARSIIPEVGATPSSIEEAVEEAKVKPGQSSIGDTADAFRAGVTQNPPVPPPRPQSATENLLNKMKVPESVEGSFRGALKKGAIGMALVGAGFGLLNRLKEEDQAPNYLLPEYDEFLKAQSQFYGSKEHYQNYLNEKYRMEGLQEQGLMAELRKMFTDFGSPYQGMGYSTYVLDDMQLRRERQKYKQAQFGSRHFSVDGDIGYQLTRFVSSLFKKQMGTNVKAPMYFGNYQKIDNTKYHSLKGDNLVEYKFNPADIDISDADTITIRRNGGPDNALSAFMGTGAQDSMTFRLAGIDAPETAHGDRSAQPYAEAAKQVAMDLIKDAKDVRVVSRPDDRTYGRQVGMVFIDGKNLNLELVRRGAAAYLPYKGKGKSQFYNQKSFEDAQRYAQESKRGMWATAYFQAYQQMTMESGQTVTFNTLVNPSKVAKNASLMSMYALMNQADKMGFINTGLQQQLAAEGQRQKFAASKSDQNIFSPDDKYNSWMGAELGMFGQGNNSITSVLDQLKTEVAGLYKTKGSKHTSGIAASGRVSGANMNLVADSLRSATLNWNSEKETRLSNIQKNKIRKTRRLKAMEEMQQTALRNQFNSPIAHHRM